MVTASMEPEPALDEDLKARRLEAIKAKALEIEKVLRIALNFCEMSRLCVLFDRAGFHFTSKSKLLSFSKIYQN